MADIVEKRDSKTGKFLPGHTGGPGRPPRIKEAAYVATIESVCSIEDWASIAKRAVKDAKNGDAQARNWLSKYLIGDSPVAIQALQINQYPGENQGISESTLILFAQLLSRMSSALSASQREDFERHMLALTKIVAPSPNDDSQPYTVDEYGVVAFDHQVRPYTNVER